MYLSIYLPCPTSLPNHYFYFIFLFVCNCDDRKSLHITHDSIVNFYTFHKWTPGSNTFMHSLWLGFPSFSACHNYIRFSAYEVLYACLCLFVSHLFFPSSSYPHPSHVYHTAYLTHIHTYLPHACLHYTYYSTYIQTYMRFFFIYPIQHKRTLLQDIIY